MEIVLKINLTLDKQLKANEVTFGGWLTFADPAVVELMAGIGFDWILTDTETRF